MRKVHPRMKEGAGIGDASTYGVVPLAIQRARLMKQPWWFPVSPPLQPVS
jgi:hypothetical protein